MKVIGMTEAKERLPALIKKAGDNHDLERLLMSRSKRLKSLLEGSRAAGQRGEVVTLEAAFAHLEE